MNELNGRNELNGNELNGTGGIVQLDLGSVQEALDSANMAAGFAYQASGAGALEATVNSVLHPIDTTIGLGRTIWNAPTTIAQATFNTEGWLNSKSPFEKGSLAGGLIFGVTTAGLSTHFSADTGFGYGAAGPVEQPRNVLGQFAVKSGGEVVPGSIAEWDVWGAIREKPGWTVTPGRIYVERLDGQVRVYDGFATSPSLRNIGLEVKSGSGRLTPEQRAFDTWLNSSRENKAIGIGEFKGVEIDRAIEIRR